MEDGKVSARLINESYGDTAHLLHTCTMAHAMTIKGIHRLGLV